MSDFISNNTTDHPDQIQEQIHVQIEEQVHEQITIGSNNLTELVHNIIQNNTENEQVDEEQNVDEQVDEEQVDEEQNEEDENYEDEEENHDEEPEQVIMINEELRAHLDLHVDNKIGEIMNWSNSNIFNILEINPEITNLIYNCYLENMQYDDNEIETLRYTIRSAFNSLIDIELKVIVSGLLYMGMNINGEFVSWEYNYEALVGLINSELRIIIRRNLFFIAATQVMNQGAGLAMEDVKLILSQEELDKIPIKTFSELEAKTKEINCKCLVCQEEHLDYDKVRTLTCGHCFHQDCVDGWLSNHSHKCPSCREPAGKHSHKM